MAKLGFHWNDIPKNLAKLLEKSVQDNISSLTVSEMSNFLDGSFRIKFFWASRPIIKDALLARLQTIFSETPPSPHPSTSSSSSSASSSSSSSIDPTNSWRNLASYPPQISEAKYLSSIFFSLGKAQIDAKRMLTDGLKNILLTRIEKNIDLFTPKEMVYLFEG